MNFVAVGRWTRRLPISRDPHAGHFRRENRLETSNASNPPRKCGGRHVSAVQQDQLAIAALSADLLVGSPISDRVNIGFAKLQMQSDLGFSDAAYGVGAGIFFIGYVLFEIPSNLMLPRVGARKTLQPHPDARGITSACMLFVRDVPAFYAMRFLLGIFEAGFAPGMISVTCRAGTGRSAWRAPSPSSSLAGPIGGIPGRAGLGLADDLAGRRRQPRRLAVDVPGGGAALRAAGPAGAEAGAEQAVRGHLA